MPRFPHTKTVAPPLCMWLSWLLLIAVSGQPLQGASRDRPNVLLIVADDLGYSDLGCYGGEIQTPNLDRLASQGLRFSRFYNMGRCCPSRTTILTGQYPHRVGVGHKVADLGRPGYRGRVAPDAVTIGQVLQRAGYRTFMSGKWHLGTPDPTRHGFEEFFGTLISAQTFWDQQHYLRLPANRPPRNYPVGKFYATDAVTDYGLDFLQQARETPQRPWFLYLAFHAPHFPLQALPTDIAKYADRYTAGWDQLRAERLAKMKKLGIVPAQTPLTPRSRYWNYGETVTGTNPAWDTLPAARRIDLARRMAIYAAMIDRIDHNVGRVINNLERRGELDDTLIIFLSDNGACAEWDPYGFDIKSSNHNILHQGAAIENMGGPGTYHSVGSGWANASNTPWRLQKHFNHEGGISSPCIIHWPAQLTRRGKIDHQPTHIIDLMPTIAAATQSTYHGKLPLAGISWTKRMKQQDQQPRTLYYEHEGNRAIHDGRYKLVALRDEPWELYDMESDRVELKDLAQQKPQLVKQLAIKWTIWADANYVTPLPRDYGVKYLRKPATDSPAGGGQNKRPKTSAGTSRPKQNEKGN